MEASGDIVAFTDDDAEVDPLWLEALLANFADPTVALATGITLPRELQTEAQIWFERINKFNRGYERREFDIRRFDPLGAGEIGGTANAAIRKSVLSDTGLFDEALGAGTHSFGGEDQEFFYRIVARGHRAVYDPSAIVWHTHRREWSDLRRTLYGYAVGLFAWWTRALILEREWSLILTGPRWFLRQYVREFLRAVLHLTGSLPLDIAGAQLAGAVVGPWAYWKARKSQSAAARRDGRPYGLGTANM
jgi:GT2 family glycosyltransferase